MPGDCEIHVVVAMQNPLPSHAKKVMSGGCEGRESVISESEAERHKDVFY